jgi:hypothetical protein
MNREENKTKKLFFKGRHQRVTQTKQTKENKQRANRQTSSSRRSRPNQDEIHGRMQTPTKTYNIGSA